jgi:hypothetical protein
LTFVLFVTARLTFVQLVRPTLVSPLFEPFSSSHSLYVASEPSFSSAPWFTGFGYRHIPGSPFPSSSSYIKHIVGLCSRADVFPSCLTAHGVQLGNFYQPESHYWPLQWGEAGAFVAATVALFGIAFWAIRRWRA